MCGLSGIAPRDPTRVPDAARIRAMTDVIAHRGPDDFGHHVAPGVALGSRRLAIMDLSPRGHMPMQTADGRWHIAYNGEVYNAAELRRWLEGRGVRFHSTTDTEVVLQGFVAEGPAVLERLNGMFAFAVWDAETRTLFAARDRLGVKPLYYVVDDEGLRLASEQKALFAGGVRPAFDASTWEELLCFRYVAGERTPFVGVRRLLPGHCLTWRAGELAIRRWWHLGERVEARRAAAPTTRDEAVRWYRETFDDAVALRRISDVPVGVLLSGGLDSGTVASSLAAQAGSGVESFTVRFADAGVDEGPLARQVVERWRLVGHELVVPEDQLLPRLLRTSWLNDEPLVHGNEAHIEAISAYAKPHVTVLLSGEGADETLGGYVRYRPLQHPRLLATLRAGSAVVPAAALPGGRVAKLHRLLRQPVPHAAVLLNASELLPSELAAHGVQLSGEPFAFRQQVLDDARRLYPREPVRQAMYLDQHTFLCSLLDRNDRMTMGASIECREPFLDYRLVEGAAALPTAQLLSRRRSKALLRDALGDRLPPDVLGGRKWGFGVPWAHYFRTVPELQERVRALPDAPAILDGPFDRRALRRRVEWFLAGSTAEDALVRQLMMVAVWHEAVIGAAAAVRSPEPIAA